MNKIFSLTAEEDFSLVIRRGRRAENQFFRMSWILNNLNLSRYAFVVPKSVDKRATVRNRLRRMAKEWVRKNIQKRNIHQDMIISIKKESLNLPRNKFYEELAKIFRNSAG